MTDYLENDQLFDGFEAAIGIYHKLSSVGVRSHDQ